YHSNIKKNISMIYSWNPLRICGRLCGNCFNMQIIIFDYVNLNKRRGCCDLKQSRIADITLLMGSKTAKQSNREN
ncbi:MAG: hypothetical protein ACOYIF_12170, partial [Acetivibrionales bacterium]